jgi:hypothetical protein
MKVAKFSHLSHEFGTERSAKRELLRSVQAFDWHLLASSKDIFE